MFLWPLGRIIQVHPGRDGRVRSVDVEVIFPKDKDTVEVRDEGKIRWNAKKCGRTCLLPKKILNRDITRLIWLHVGEEENSPGNKTDKSPEPGDDRNPSEIEDSQEDEQGRNSPGNNNDRRVKFREKGENSPGEETDGRKAPGEKTDGQEVPGAKTDGRKAPGAKTDGRKAPGEKNDGQEVPGAKTDGRKSPGENDTWENDATDLGNRNTNGRNPKLPLAPRFCPRKDFEC